MATMPIGPAEVGCEAIRFRLEGTPSRLASPDEATAIARAIEQFQIPEGQWLKLTARRG